MVNQLTPGPCVVRGEVTGHRSQVTICESAMSSYLYRIKFPLYIRLPRKDRGNASILEVVRRKVTAHRSCVNTKILRICGEFVFISYLVHIRYLDTSLST